MANPDAIPKAKPNTVYNFAVVALASNASKVSAEKIWRHIKLHHLWAVTLLHASRFRELEIKHMLTIENKERKVTAELAIIVVEVTNEGQVETMQRAIRSQEYTGKIALIATNSNRKAFGPKAANYVNFYQQIRSETIAAIISGSQ